MADDARRRFLKNSGMAALTFWVGGCQVETTPEEARSLGASYRLLDTPEVDILEALAETLVPGAAEAGAAHFIDSQLEASPADSLLMIRYLGVPPPFTDFYRGGLAALEAFARGRHGAGFASLDPEAQLAVVADIAAANPDGWDGPPAPFFYFVLRNDAVDVVFGTPQGVEALGVPYMAHITPPPGWQA